MLSHVCFLALLSEALVIKKKKKNLSKEEKLSLKYTAPVFSLQTGSLLSVVKLFSE